MIQNTPRLLAAVAALASFSAVADIELVVNTAERLGPIKPMNAFGYFDICYNLHVVQARSSEGVKAGLLGPVELNFERSTEVIKKKGNTP